jgi:GntR family transcriptional repressor for pyruvate dehydrogenase complex
MESIKRVRLSERVLEAINKIIEEENFVPGDKFYSENQLTKRLGVSRSSVREAIRILEVTGHVKVKHGMGVFVTDSMDEEREAFKDWVKNNETAIFDHFDVRLIIDPKAAAYAAMNADAHDIEKLKEIYEDFTSRVKCGNTSGLIRCDEEFHQLLSNSTKNKTLYFLMKTMTNSLPEGWLTTLHIPGRAEKTITEHGKILQAIEEGDSEKAEAAMKEHLLNAIEDIKASMKK